ncbi:MAG TPA: hypothetical protein VG738_16015 [Chitinophagaceae bacterium]|nr:hypothetical protein [Chitinophagaceae bacterium]
MTTQDVDLFEKIQSQIEGLHAEIGALSKKSQNDALNKFKLKFVNQLLLKANTLLTDSYKPFSGFDIFDEVEMPTNSDVILILTQYLNCLEILRADNIQRRTSYPYVWCWVIENKLTDRQTYSPKNIKED